MRGDETMADPAGFASEESAGVFVGVRLFPRGCFGEIPWAVDDAVDLAYLFSRTLELLRPERIRLVLSGRPGKEASERHLRQLIDAGAQVASAELSEIYDQVGYGSGSTGPQGLFILSMATHGFVTTGETTLFAASDTSRNFQAGTAVRQDLLIDNLRQGQAPRRLLLLDTCREEQRASHRGSTPVFDRGLVEAIARTSGIAVLAASARGGRAFDDPSRGNGVFTASVIEGLLGGARPDPARRITVAALAEFVQSRVTHWLERHRPPGWNLGDPVGSLELEGSAGRIPLVDLGQLERRLLGVRQEAARDRMGANLRGVLTGAWIDAAMRVLQEQGASPAGVELLEEIEALDGSERMRRNLVHYLSALPTKRGGQEEALELFRQGLDLQYGRRVDVDRPAARSRFEAAAALGDPTARLWLASLRRSGLCGYAMEPAAAIDLGFEDWAELEARARGGQVEAALALSLAYEQGTGVEKDGRRAIAALDSSTRGYDVADLHGAYLADLGIGGSADSARAFRAYADLARTGLVAAMYLLAHACRWGRGTPVDEAAAALWYRAAAERGFPPAMGALAACRLGGCGVAIDPGEALHWSMQGARAGDPESMILLAALRADGELGLGPDQA